MSRYPRRRWELGWEEVRGLQHAKQSGLKTVDLQGREQPAAVSGGGGRPGRCERGHETQ